MMDLTARETAVLTYLAGHIEARGYGPSYDDIARVVGLSSKSRVAAVVGSLEAQGAVRRIYGHARSLSPLVQVAVPRCPAGEPLFFVRMEGTE